MVLSFSYLQIYNCRSVVYTGKKTTRWTCYAFSRFHQSENSTHMLQKKVSWLTVFISISQTKRWCFGSKWHRHWLMIEKKKTDRKLSHVNNNKMYWSQQTETARRSVVQVNWRSWLKIHTEACLEWKLKVSSETVAKNWVTDYKN